LNSRLAVFKKGLSTINYFLTHQRCDQCSKWSKDDLVVWEHFTESSWMTCPSCTQANFAAQQQKMRLVSVVAERLVPLTSR